MSAGKRNLICLAQLQEAEDEEILWHSCTLSPKTDHTHSPCLWKHVHLTRFTDSVFMFKVIKIIFENDPEKVQYGIWKKIESHSDFLSK